MKRKALRKAIALSDSNNEAHIELAILLEYNAAGERYANGARISDAVTLYRDILTKGPNPMVSQNLTLALMHLGRYQEAEEESKKLTEQPIYGVISVALATLREGPDKAILSTQNGISSSAARAANLSGAAATLTQLREYKAGVELLRAAQRLDGDPKLAQMLGLFEKMQRHETALSPDGDPRSPVQRFLVLASLGPSSPGQLAALLSKDADPVAWRARLEHTRKSLGLFRIGMRSNGISSASVADLILGQTKLEINDQGESGKPADAARAASPQGSSKIVQKRVSRGGSSRVAVVTVTSHVNLGVLMFFITREDGVCKLLGTGDGLESVGRIALAALAQNDLATAQEWLDAVKNYALPVSSRDDKGPAIRYLWAGTAPETRSSIFARAAAASLEGTYSGSPEAIKTLQRIAEHPPAYIQQEDLDFAICEALNKARNWQELRTRSRVLLRSKYYQEPAMRFLGNALIGLGQWADLAKAAEERLAISAKDHSALQLAAIAAMARADYDGAAKYLTRSKDAPYSALFSDKVLTAWNGILARKIPDEVLGELEADNMYTLVNEGSTYVYTVALAQLRNGKTELSVRSLAMGLEMDTTVPSGLAWLVERELMKSYQLDAAAVMASEHVQKQGRSEGSELVTLLFSE